MTKIILNRMEHSPLISMMKRAMVLANLDEEIEASLESRKTASRKERKNAAAGAKEQVNLDSNRRVIKLGHQDIIINKTWSLASIRADSSPDMVPDISELQSRSHSQRPKMGTGSQPNSGCQHRAISSEPLLYVTAILDTNKKPKRVARAKQDSDT